MRASLLAWALALVVAAVAASASAQERVVHSARVDAWDVADLSWQAAAPDTGAVRVLVRGSLTCAIDGAEIDAMQIVTTSRVEDVGSPLVFPEGARLVEVRGVHEYVFDVPPGPGATIALNVPGLAARHLVTASDLRNSITGAIFVDVLSDAPAAAATPSATAVVAEPDGLTGLALAGGALGLPLLAFGLFVATRRRGSREDQLMLRVRRARSEIVREARALGAAFDGALASAEALVDAARRQRAHLTQLDRALARTAWVSTVEASASRETLVARRAEALARLESIVARLEETLVRMAACVADRSAIAGIERDLAGLRGEVEVGESVEQEIASLDRG
jgi:hypothetical protein